MRKQPALKARFTFDTSSMIGDWLSRAFNTCYGVMESWGRGSGLKLKQRLRR
jgi:hypothetical protein